MELSRYLKFYPSKDGDSVLIYSTLRGAKLTVSSAFADSIRNLAVEGPHRETLLRLGILVPDARAEQEQLKSFFQLCDQNQATFRALVTLNLDCNLACSYCYESHFRGTKYMTEATADLVVQTLLDHPLAATRDINVDFYGGEPLLSVPLIRRISLPLQSAVRERGKSYACTLVTNGTLLNRSAIEELLPLGLIGAKFTLDGPPEIHDRQRPFASGRESFAAILRNLKEISGHIGIHLGGNFSRDNYRRFLELLDILLAEGITPDRLQSVQFVPITPTAGEAGLPEFSAGCASSSEPWLVEASLFLREETLKRGFKVKKPQVSGCMVESANQMVIGYDGAVFKCPAFMGWPDLSIGTLAQGIGEYRRSHDLGAWQNDACLECAYLPLCFGGCRFLQRLTTGSVRGVECRKELLDATLEATVRQDLAYS